MPKRSIPKGMRYATLSALLLGLGGVGAWGAADQREADTDQPSVQAPEAVSVSVDQGSVTYVCPPGVIDPQDLSVSLNVSGPFPTASGEAQRLDGGGVALEVDPDADPDADAGGASFVAAGQVSGDLASYLLAGCQLPSREALLPAGSTQVGEDTVLILSNPSTKPVTASVQVLSSIGAVLDAPQEVVVPAGSTFSVLPAIWAPLESRIALLVQSDGQGVAAWLQSSGLEGEVPIGLGRLGAQSLSETVSIIGIDSGQDNTLRLVNMGTSPAEMSIQLLTDHGKTPLAGVEGLVVEAHGVFDVALGDLPTSAYGLLVESEEPIAAAIRAVSEGQPFPEDETLNVSLRNLIGGADAVESVTVPGADILAEAANALGFALVRSDVIIANLEDRAISVQVGDEVVLLDPGTSYTAALPATQTLILQGEESAMIRAALIVEAEADSGVFRSVVPLEEETLGSAQLEVVVFPQH